MPRRITPAELRRRLKEAERKQKQAISKYNREIRNYNRAVKRAVDNYNREVRSYNARVRANRQRLRNEINRLQTRSSSTSRSGGFVVYRSSVRVLHESYTRLESREAQLGPKYNRILDLSEREAANSVEVTNRLLDSTDQPQTNDDLLADAELIDELRAISPELDDRWRGALFALSPENPDAARHFCTSAREILATVLEIKAPDTAVKRALPGCDLTERGTPTRRSKIKYLLHRRELGDEALEEFVDQDLENVLQLFRVFNDGTHGTAGRFALHQLESIRKRVKDSIFFLTEISRIEQ